MLAIASDPGVGRPPDAVSSDQWVLQLSPPPALHVTNHAAANSREQHERCL